MSVLLPTHLPRETKSNPTIRPGWPVPMEKQWATRQNRRKLHFAIRDHEMGCKCLCAFETAAACAMLLQKHVLSSY
eukprot:456134-Amphidinium_carterae.1